MPEAEVSGITAPKPEAREEEPKISMQVDSYVRRRNLFKRLWISPLLLRNANKTNTAVQTPKVIKTLRVDGTRNLRAERSRELHKVCNKLLRAYLRNDHNESEKQTHRCKRKRRSLRKKIILKSKSAPLKLRDLKAANVDKDPRSESESIEDHPASCLRKMKYQTALLMVDEFTEYQDFDLLGIECGPHLNVKRKYKRKRFRKKKFKSR